MNAVEALLLAFDDAWKDPFESFDDAVRDLTEEESVWQPPSYTGEPHDEGVGRPGTILWHLNHLELCHRHYIEIINLRDPDKRPETEPPGELPLKPALSALGTTTQELRDTIAGLRPEDLDTTLRPDRNTGSFIAMVIRHFTWHTAQIKQTRRLHARRG